MKDLNRKINRLGDLIAQIDALEREAKKLRAELIDSRISEHDTGRFHMVVYDAERSTLNREAVMRELGEAWVKRHSTLTYYAVCRVTPINKLKLVA